MKVTIREAGEKDFFAILALIKELALFEKAPEKVTNSVDQMMREKDLFHCLVAETAEKEIVGMALYFFAYYTWVGKSLYLDDLYVKETFRGQETGTKLLKKIIQIAEEKNCKRVRWQVLNWNKPAIDMYRKCGATIDDEWINCDINAGGIKEFKI